MDLYDLLVDIIFPPLILVLGLFGNFMGYLVLRQARMQQIGPRNMYQYLLSMDSFYLIQITINYAQFGFKTDWPSYSKIGCKFWFYVNYAFATVSPMCLVYISADRYISIKYPTIRFLMRKRNNQLIYFLSVTFFNMIYYLPVLFSYSLVKVDLNLNNTQLDTVCTFINLDYQNIVAYMDLVNRSLLPFILILIFSILLSIEIFQSRKRILNNFKIEENQHFFSEIRLAVTSVCLNVFFMILQMPISIYDLIPDYYLIPFYSFAYFVFYMSYSINFYVLLFSNLLFKNQFYLLLKNIGDRCKF